jgi:Zn-dependent protease
MRLIAFLEKSLPLLFWILISFSFDLPYVAILTGISAVIHELGHFLFILIERGFPEVKNRLSGPKFKISVLGYREELLIALAGPLANLSVAIILLPMLILRPNSYVFEFFIINALTAVLNLLPINGFDGYKALHCFVAERKNGEAALPILYHTSILITALLTLLSLYFVLKLGEGYWIFALFFSVLISEIAKSQKHTI